MRQCWNDNQDAMHGEETCHGVNGMPQNERGTVGLVRPPFIPCNSPAESISWVRLGLRLGVRLGPDEAWRESQRVAKQGWAPPDLLHLQNSSSDPVGER